MRHRLFHSLVLSSSVLLEACAGSAASSANEPSSSNETSGGDTANAADTSSGGETQGDTANVGPPPVSSLNAADQAAVARAVADERACESGWPTTKGARMASDGTNAFWCSNLSSEGPACCISGPAPTP